MTRVTLLCSRFVHRGGLEKSTIRLAQAFRKAGCTVTLLTTEKGELEGINVIPLITRSRWTQRHLLAFDAHCQDWLRKHPQEIVFGMERTTYRTHYRAGSGVHAVYLERRKLVDSPLKTLSHRFNPLHCTLLRMEKQAFESPFLRLLFTNSQMVKDEILQHYDTPAEKLLVVHNGVEWEESGALFASPVKPREGPFEFLFLGNGYRRKGLSFLLDGLAALKESDYHLSIVGKDRELPCFHRKIQRLGLTGRATLHGPTLDPRPFYQKADALVIPSIYDPFANVTLEALALGLFVVSSPYNGGKEVLQPHSGTIIEKLTSPDSVAAALKIALNTPKTPPPAVAIRESIRELDYSRQLDIIVSKTLESIH